MNHNFTKFDYANMRTVNICIITIRPIKAIKTRNRRQSDSFASCVLSERGFPCNLTNNRIVVFPNCNLTNDKAIYDVIGGSKAALFVLSRTKFRFYHEAVFSAEIKTEADNRAEYLG